MPDLGLFMSQVAEGQCNGHLINMCGHSDIDCTLDKQIENEMDSALSLPAG